MQVYTLPELTKQYEISFDVNPTSFVKGQWTSVLHLTISGDADKYGARIPGVWFSPHPSGNTNSILSSMAVDGK